MIAAGPSGRGEVASFDAEVGLGTVRSGQDLYPFHCTTIADGSRAVEVGAEVEFDLVFARNGRTEAAAVRQVAPTS